MTKLMRAVGVAGALGLAAVTAFAGEISGAGATFPYPIYAKWADAYKKETGIGLNYQSIGSGGGIKQIKARTVTFGASDKPLTEQELEKAGNLMQWPMVMGGIVPVVNLPGIHSDQLTLDGTTLSRIFLGEITKWNDPALRKLNPGLKLPSAAIAVVHRSDGSGTTFNFTNYLSKVSESWKTNVGEATSVQWPVGIGAKGNEGVANNVQQTKNSIGYVETAYAKQNKLTTTRMVNKAGKAVSATADSVQAAAANADWAHAPGFFQIITDQPGDASWPISASTFILMPMQVRDANASREALKFFSWCYAHGDAAAAGLDYVPMPANVKKLVESRWKEIKDADGKPVL
ncbi:MAG: phosphate ABC transporter substrate-binding protein PstS [Betaproteobacteria bacterium]|nr:phosphate ABC transporter substrate-binding protein PstS [Betaproteobacteria bacterium]